MSLASCQQLQLFGYTVTVDMENVAFGDGSDVEDSSTQVWGGKLSKPGFPFQNRGSIPAEA